MSQIMLKKTLLPMKTLGPIIESFVNDGKEVIITVTGNSMKPFLHNEQDQAVLKKFDGSASKGDVILYLRKNGQYVLHRIYKIENDCYIMLGDAQTQREFGIEPSQVIAVATAFIRNKKKCEADSAAVRLYVKFWFLILPLRTFLQKTRTVIGKMRRRLLQN